MQTDLAFALYLITYTKFIRRMLQKSNVFQMGILEKKRPSSPTHPPPHGECFS